MIYSSFKYFFLPFILTIVYNVMIEQKLGYLDWVPFVYFQSYINTIKGFVSKCSKLPIVWTETAALKWFPKQEVGKQQWLQIQNIFKVKIL